MEEKKKVMIDAGHGGTKDPGAVFEDRMEKDDTLRLALAVGRILEENGVNAVYTRSTDVYDTPYQKAEMGNEAGADYFVSLHRNAASEPGKGSGVMTLVYKTGRESEQLADSIQRELARSKNRVRVSQATKTERCREVLKYREMVNCRAMRNSRKMPEQDCRLAWMPQRFQNVWLRYPITVLKNTSFRKASQSHFW